MDWGVDTVFGLPGDGINGIMEALRKRQDEIKFIPLQSAYCGAKHAVQGFTESVRTELLHDHSNVWITMVHLPASNTPQFNWVKTRLPRKPQPYPPVFQP